MGKCQRKNVWLFVHNMTMTGLPEPNNNLLTHTLFHTVPQIKNVLIRGDNLFCASFGARDAMQEQKVCWEITP